MSGNPMFSKIFYTGVLLALTINLPLVHAQDWRKAKEYFEKAKRFRESAEGNYQIATRLRLGDIEVFSNEDKIEGLKNAKKHYEEAMGYGRDRKEIDKELNDISYLFYIQSLIIYGENDEAIKVCNLDKIWDNHKIEKDANVKYLEAYALYSKAKDTDSDSLKNAAADSLKRIAGYPLADYLLGVIYSEVNTSKAIKHFQSLIDANASVPENIYLPYSELGDRNVLDNAHLKLGGCYLKLNKINKALVEFGKVIILYPYSDSVTMANNSIKKIPVKK